MTNDDHESLAEAENDANLAGEHDAKRGKAGTDALKSILTAAIHKHAKKKHSKKSTKSKSEILEDKEPPPDTSSSKDVIETEEQISPGSSKKQSSSGRDALKDAGQAALGITVHCCDRLEASPVIFPHPVVQVHVCDADTGKWLQKSAKDRKVTSYYEGSEVDYILPIMTQPFDMKKNRSLCCQWQEQLIFNESKEHFVTEQPAVLIFFQLMDFSSTSNISGISGNQTQNSSTCGWVTLAWAFLKIKGSNNHINIGNKLRLQLWRPRKSTKVNLTELYCWWKSGSRSKYSSTLLVSLQEICIPQNPHPALRSMLVTQREYGGELVPENLQGDVSRRESYSNPSVNTKDCSVDWGRKPNQSCRIPNSIKHCLHHAEEGCMIVKFSHNGLKLACGAHNQIFVYEVISGKLEFVFSGHLGLIYDICWSDNDQKILSASGDSTARVWNVEPGVKCGSSQTLTHPSHVYCARFVPLKPQVFVSGSYDHVLRVWFSDRSGEYVIIQELTNHLGFVNALCFSTEGDTLYSGDKQGVIKVWNVKVPKKAHGKKIIVLTLQHEIKMTDILGKVINSIVYHPGGYRILVHTRDSQLKLVNHKQWTITHRLTGMLNVREQLRGCISPCGTWVVSGSEDYGVYVWHSDTGDLTSAFHNLPIKGTISCVDFHPFDNFLAVCSYARETPILILSYNPEKSSANNIILSTNKLANPSVLSGSALRSHKNGYIDSDDSELLDRNMQNRLSFPTASSVLISQEPGCGKVPSSLEIKLNTDDIKYIDAKEMWHDVGRKILHDLDNILKMASEDPLSMDNRYIGNDQQELIPLGNLATVLFDYEASESDEISVKQGDYVMVLKNENKDWWQVRTADMKSTGFVPASYLKQLPDHNYHHYDDSAKVIAVTSGTGEVSFITDVEGTPSKARARRHKAKGSTSQNIIKSSTPKNK